jgi:hypothetical protein
MLYAIKMYCGVKVQLQLSWYRHWMEVSDQVHATAALSLAKERTAPI